MAQSSIVETQTGCRGNRPTEPLMVPDRVKFLRAPDRRDSLGCTETLGESPRAVSGSCDVTCTLDTEIHG
jgi:hypothetical protein